MLYVARATWVEHFKCGCGVVEGDLKSIVWNVKKTGIYKNISLHARDKVGEQEEEIQYI